MVQSPYKVLSIFWDGFPKSEWGKVLSSIPVGGYVASLPYDYIQTTNYKIPIPSKITQYKTDEFPNGVPLNMDYLEFQQTYLSKSGDICQVWQRII